MAIIAKIKTISLMKTGLKIYKDTAGDWRWRIVSRNGRIIAASTEGYRRKRSAIANLKGILQALAVVLSK